MAKPWAKPFYNSAAWKKCRHAYIMITHGICETLNCNTAGYIVDHIIELTPENITNPDITLNHDNLQYLCTECHNTKTHLKYSATVEGVMFDAEGNLVEGNEISKTKKYRRKDD